MQQNSGIRNTDTGGEGRRPVVYNHDVDGGGNSQQDFVLPTISKLKMRMPLSG